MALLHNKETGREVPVAAELVIGRSPSARLRLKRPYVSGLHASLRWSSKCWQLRDLGSRNGTFLNGTRLEQGQICNLTKGDTITFGRDTETWEVTDDAPPQPMLLADNDEAPRIIDKDVIGIPCDEAPVVTALRDVDGVWKLESADGQLRVIDGEQSYPIDGRVWQFSFPDVVGPTHSLAELELNEDVQLQFGVSQDEEHIELDAITGTGRTHLGSRTHNYLLLTLARARVEDQHNGVAEGSCGWVYQDDLMRDLQIERTQLNLEIFRIRRHFADKGLQESLSIIERRPTTKQLRIGAGKLDIGNL